MHPSENRPKGYQTTLHPGPISYTRLADGVTLLSNIFRMERVYDDGLRVEVDVAVHEGEARCDQVVVNRTDAGAIDSRMFRFPLQAWIDDGVALMSMVGGEQDDGRWHGNFATSDEQRQKVAAAVHTTRRRRINKKMLEEVSEAYQHGGQPEVRRRFFVSDAQAYRYIRKARDIGALGVDE